MVDAASPVPSPLEVLIVSPPDQQGALAAALPPPAFHPFFAVTDDAASRPPAIIVFSLDDAADLPRLTQLAAGGPPVVVLLAVPAGLAARALAAGASEYVYRVGNWTALLPFHLWRAAGTVVPVRVGQQQVLDQLAHDLRGPLTYLVGYSELLTMRDLPPEKVRQMAQEMLREAEKLSRRLDRFLPSRTD